jgi:transcriptional regulator with XRE-family HTH domain
MTANQFRTAIAALGWSQVHAASELGIAPRTARSYALGERPVPAPIVKLLEAALARETERQ